MFDLESDEPSTKRQKLDEAASDTGSSVSEPSVPKTQDDYFNELGDTEVVDLKTH
jgi:hypothetical protein